MGVKGLTTYLSQHNLAVVAVPIREIIAALPCRGSAHPTVIVDGPAFVAWLGETSWGFPVASDAPFPGVLGGDYSAIARAVTEFVRAFTREGVDLHFIFDGYGGTASSGNKAFTIQERFEMDLLNSVAVEDYIDGGSVKLGSPVRRTLGTYSSSAPNSSALQVRIPLATEQVVTTLISCGVRCSVSMGEADSAAAGLVANPELHVVGVLSADSDFLIYEGCRYLPLDALQLPHIGNDKLTNDTLTSVIRAALLTPRDIAAALDVPLRLLPDVAVLVGNDYSAPELAAVDAHTRLLGSLRGGGAAAVVKSVLEWLRQNVCSCDSTSAAQAAGESHCEVCQKPLSFEKVPAAAALLAESPALAASVSYSRATYSHCAASVASIVDDFASLKGASHVSGAPSDEPEDQLTAYLRGAPWSAAFYAAVRLRAMPGSALRLLEERTLTVRPTGAEAIALDVRLLTGASITRGMRAALYGWTLPRFGSDKPDVVHEMVAFGVSAAWVAVRPLRDQQLLVRPGQAANAYAGIAPDDSNDNPMYESRVPQVLAMRSALPRDERARLFAAAMTVALWGWQDTWTTRPQQSMDLAERAMKGETDASARVTDDKLIEQVTRDLSVMALHACSAGNPSPWLRVAITSDVTPVHLFKQSIVRATDDRDASRRIAAVVATAAVSHLVAVTSHVWRLHQGHEAAVHVMTPRRNLSSKRAPLTASQRCTFAPPVTAALPSLPELASLLGMLALLHAPPLHASTAACAPAASPPTLQRPRLRAVNAASWYQAIVREILALGAAAGVLTPALTFDVVPPIESDCRNHLAALVAAGLGSHAAVAIAPISPPPVPCPEPKILFGGREFHALAQSLGDMGEVPPVAALEAAGGSASSRGFTAVNYLTHNAIAILEARGALDLLEELWDAAFSPFDVEVVARGYAAIAAEAAAHLQHTTTASVAHARAVKPSPAVAMTPPQAAMVKRASSLSTQGAAAAAVLATTHSLTAPPALTQQPMAESDGHTAVLPIVAFRRDIVSAIAAHTVTIIKAETGSGKSTKTPQYIYEAGMHCAAAGVTKRRSDVRMAANTCDDEPPPDVWGDRLPNIYVTQPRRVAAVTLARRVSSEIGEADVGGLVGYRIGHDRCASQRTRITFVTTGWLLQWLVSVSNEMQASNDEDAPADGVEENLELDEVTGGDGGLGQVTHIVLDEVRNRTKASPREGSL